MAKRGSKKYLMNVRKGLKQYYKFNSTWNKGKSGYKRVTKNPEQASKNISKGVKKAWRVGKYNNVDYSKSKKQREKLSKAKIRYYKLHPEAKKEHSQKLKGMMVGEKNPNFGKTHEGLNKGEKNPAFNGWSSLEPYGIGFDDKTKEQIKARDGYRCQVCFDKYKLVVHHIDYDKKNNKSKNMIALCRSCHSKTNHNRTYWINYFKENFG